MGGVDRKFKTRVNVHASVVVEAMYVIANDARLAVLCLL